MFTNRNNMEIESVCIVYKCLLTGRITQCFFFGLNLLLFFVPAFKKPPETGEIFVEENRDVWVGRWEIKSFHFIIIKSQFYFSSKEPYKIVQFYFL